MVTIKEYASLKGVTERAVYKQLKTHDKELEGHIEKHEGKKWLDDEAVRILNSYSGNNAVVVADQEQITKIELLQNENENLKNKIMLLQDQFNKEILLRDARISELTDKVLLLTAEPEKKKHWWQK